MVAELVEVPRQQRIVVFPHCKCGRTRLLNQILTSIIYYNHIPLTSITEFDYIDKITLQDKQGEPIGHNIGN